MLYSSKNLLFYIVDVDNIIKVIVMKNDFKIVFNDKDKILIFEILVGNKFIFFDKDKFILIQDQYGNKMVMDSVGISFNSVKDIIIKVVGKIDFSVN